LIGFRRQARADSPAARLPGDRRHRHQCQGDPGPTRTQTSHAGRVRGRVRTRWRTRRRGVDHAGHAPVAFDEKAWSEDLRNTTDEGRTAATKKRAELNETAKRSTSCWPAMSRRATGRICPNASRPASPGRTDAGESSTLSPATRRGDCPSMSWRSACATTPRDRTHSTSTKSPTGDWPRSPPGICGVRSPAPKNIAPEGAPFPSVILGAPIPLMWFGGAPRHSGPHVTVCFTSLRRCAELLSQTLPSSPRPPMPGSLRRLL